MFSSRVFPSAASAAEALPAAAIQNALTQFWAGAVRPAWPLVGLAAVLVTLGSTLGPFTYAPWPVVVGRVAMVLSFIATAIVLRALDRPRLSLVTETFGLTIAVALTVPGVTAMIAALDMPYQDATLIGWDNSLGFDWQGIVEWTKAHPALSIAMSHVYSSLLWQPAIILTLLAFADPERLRRVLAASTIALVATVAIFVFFPARTGYVYLGYARADFPDLLANTAWGVAEILETIRHGGGTLSLEGLITFPSYHAVAAVLFAYSWMAIPGLRWVFVPLNIVMLISCVPIGSHYVVDVLAGVGLAFAAYGLANRYFAKTDTRPALAGWRDTPDGADILNHVAAVRREFVAHLPGLPLSDVPGA